MTTYTVYTPPKDNLVHSEENFRLVPDTKATFALFFPPFWLLWHKLWEGENKEEAEIRFIVNQGDRFAEQRPIPSNVYKPVALKPSVKKDTMSLFPE